LSASFAFAVCVVGVANSKSTFLLVKEADFHRHAHWANCGNPASPMDDHRSQFCDTQFGKRIQNRPLTNDFAV